MDRKILLILIIILSVLGITFIITFKPRVNFNSLVIKEEEWNAITSSRKEGNLSLKNLKFNDYDLIIDEKNNKIYYSVINNSTSKYSPVVTYYASSPNTKIAILDDEITADKMMNNHEFKILLYDDKTYETYGLYCTSFPMLNIVYDEQTAKEFNIPMSMYLFNNFDNGINRIVRSNGTIDKVEMENGTNNYKFSLVMTTPGNKERENVISLLHMKPSNEYFLNVINTGENKSEIKNNKTERIDKMAERNEQKVELFVNGQYVGLYSLSYNPDIKIRPRNR